jgi:hypothetical protein
MTVRSPIGEVNLAVTSTKLLEAELGPNAIRIVLTTIVMLDDVSTTLVTLTHDPGPPVVSRPIVC